MKRTTLIVLISIYSIGLFSQEYLRFSNPQSFKYGTGTILSASVVLKPQGHFMQYDFYLEYGGKDFFNGYNDKDTLEVIQYFILPEQASIIDSWLWVEDQIMKAMILDRGTALNIYEGIVNRRRDPSILYKNNKTQYQFRIYPLQFEKNRKVKLSILMPMKQIENENEFQLPFSLLKTSKVIPNLNIIVYEKDIEDKVVKSLDYVFKEEIDSTFGKYFITKVASSTIKNSTSIDLTLVNTYEKGLDLFYDKSISDDEGYYQIMIDKTAFISDAKDTGSKVLISIDFNSSTTIYSKKDILNSVEKFIKTNLSDKDSIKIYYNNFGVVKHLNKWTSTTDLNIKEIIENITLGNSSVLNSLLYDSYQNLENGEDYFLVFFTSNTSFPTPAAAQQLKDDLINNLTYLDRSYILDFSTYNLHLSKTIYGGVTYSGSELLYRILTTNTNGAYVMLNPFNFNQVLQTGITNLISEIRNFNVLATDYELKPSNGLCYDNVVMEVGGKILQTGKYIGGIPFVLETTTIYKNDILFNDITYHQDETELLNSEEFIQCYYGQKIRNLENTSTSNSIKSTIIDLSIANRVLSLYTAFLALEPSLQEPCMGCLDESQTTSTDENNIQIVITASPNPFNNKTIVNIKGIDNIESIEQLKIFDLNGKCISSSSFTLEKTKDGIQIILNGENLIPGLYFIRFIYKGKVYIYKVIRIE